MFLNKDKTEILHSIKSRINFLDFLLAWRVTSNTVQQIYKKLKRNSPEEEELHFPDTWTISGTLALFATKP
jgi:hypothetical protein